MTMNKKQIMDLIRRYSDVCTMEGVAGDRDLFDLMRKFHNKGCKILSEIETELDKVSQELDAMRPVVQAAEVWADSFTGTQAHDALEAAVDAYRAMNLTGATP